MEKNELEQELTETLDALTQIINKAKERYDKTNRTPFLQYSSFYGMMDTTGKPYIAELVATKANVLVALQSMMQKEN